MKVFFYPPSLPHNPYFDNIISGLEANGVTIVNKHDSNKTEWILSMLKAMFSHTDFFHFNWIENRSANASSKNRLICKGILIWLDLIKLSGGKLAWTMHNRESHDVDGDRSFHHTFMRSMISKMDMILVHAAESRDQLISEYDFPGERICYAPHGNYLSQDEPEPCIYSHDKLRLLSFGHIRNYKNIPMLIDVFSELDYPDTELYILGKCRKEDAGLKEEILSAISDNSSVFFEDRTVPDDQVNTVFENTDIVVLPYDKSSMINSGAAILAFSRGKPIISSCFGAIRELQGTDFVYTYDYDSPSDHKEKLKAVISRVHQDWTSDHGILAVKGKHAYRYARESLSWNNICATIADKYRELSI